MCTGCSSAHCSGCLDEAGCIEASHAGQESGQDTVCHWSDTEECVEVQLASFTFDDPRELEAFVYEDHYGCSDTGVRDGVLYENCPDDTDGLYWLTTEFSTRQSTSQP